MLLIDADAQASLTINPKLQIDGILMTIISRTYITKDITAQVLMIIESTALGLNLLNNSVS